MQETHLQKELCLRANEVQSSTLCYKNYTIYKYLNQHKALYAAGKSDAVCPPAEEIKKREKSLQKSEKRGNKI